MPPVPRALIVILSVALIVRVGVVAVTPEYGPLFDARDYHRHASSLADGNGFAPPQLGGNGPTAFRPPLYPLALASVQVVGGGMTSERLLGALLGVVTVLLVFEIARRLLGNRVALVAGALAAVFPPLFVLNASLLSEVLFLPLVLASVLVIVVYREDRRLWQAATAGALCGAAPLTRGNGLVVVAAIALGAWVGRPRFSRSALMAPVVVLVATALVLAPWVARNTLVFDRFVGITDSTAWALAGTYNPESRRIASHPGEPRSPQQLKLFTPIIERFELSEAERLERMGDMAYEYIRANPFYVVETAAWNVLRVLDIEREVEFELAFQGQTLQAVGAARLATPAYLVILYLVVGFALVGAVAQLVGRGPPRAPPFFWLVPALLVVPALGIYGLARYRAPADPFLVILAAVALVAIADLVRKRGAVR